MKRLAVVTSFLLLLAACGGGSSTSGGNNAPLNAAACQKPRPQACTREYAPVCGITNNGAMATYATACTACADTTVTGYVAGECVLTDMAVCTEPRPEICTADYRPVCGRLDGGELRTFANACSACGNTSVVGFAQGECSITP